MNPVRMEVPLAVQEKKKTKTVGDETAVLAEREGAHFAVLPSTGVCVLK